MIATLYWLNSGVSLSGFSKKRPVSSLVPLALLILIAGFSSGCATIYEGITGPSEIEFHSESEGALVKLADGRSCEMPCRFEVGEAKEQKYTVSLDGFPDQKGELERRVAYGFWANVVAFQLGLIGMGVDWLSGYMWTYDETSIEVTFAAAAPPPKTEIETPPEPPLPNTAELIRLKEQFPEDYMRRQIRNYYGGQEPQEEDRILNRLYKQMLAMVAAGDDPDVDEAVRRDHFDQIRLEQTKSAS